MSTSDQGEENYKEILGKILQIEDKISATKIATDGDDDEPSVGFQDADAQIRQLDASGDLDFVVGSRSVLTQELATDLQTSQPDDQCDPESNATTSSSSIGGDAKQDVSRKEKDFEIRHRVMQEQYAQRLAKRAAVLAKEVLNSPDLRKQVLLSMALHRKSPRNPPSQWPLAGTVLKHGYSWSHFPPLEELLRSHMAEYYDLSLKRCQSKQQQSFLALLLAQVRETAKEHKWKFDAAFNDKEIRDRIRAYYKTHIQLARKRLKTMVDNPTKRANSKSLLQHYDLIKKHAGVGCFGEYPEVGEMSSHDLVAAAQPSSLT